MPLNDLVVSQKDDVYRAVREAGLDPSEFRWTDHERFDGEMFTSPTLVHKSSGYFYVFNSEGSDHAAIFSPGASQRREAAKAGIWETQLHWVGFSALARRLWATGGG